MSAPLRILGIDPGSTEAAAALLVADPAAPHTGRLEQMWRITPKGEDLAARVIDLAEQLGDIMDAATADVIVVELPANRPMGRTGFAKRSVLDLPNYGMAVGAALIAARWHGGAAKRGSPDGEPFVLLSPSVCDWVGRDVPSSNGDPHKAARVEYAARLWGRKLDEFGPKSVAGNAADACFLARYGLWRVEA